MNVVEVTNVSKRFRENKKEFFAVKDVSFSIKKGEIFGLLGPNGAGKTTILNIIIQILAPDSGHIKIFGKEKANIDIMEQLSYVSGETRFHWALRTKDILKMYSMLYDIPKERRAKDIENLVKFFRLQPVLNRKFGYLSTGERMRLIFAKALLNRPKLLLLDEPTLGLDPDISIKVRNEIKRINEKFGTTIILTTHYMPEAEQLADRIAFIDEGKIVDIGEVQKVKMKHFENYEVIITVDKIRGAPLLKKHGFKIIGNRLRKTLSTDENLSGLISFIINRKMKMLDIESKKPTLEDYFVKISSRNK